MPPLKAKLDIPLKAVAGLPERAVYIARDGELAVSVSLNRKDTTLVIKAETDSIVPKVTMETMESLTVRKTLESERKEKPPDKVPWWQYAAVFIIILLIIKNVFKHG